MPLGRIAQKARNSLAVALASLRYGVKVLHRQNELLTAVRGDDTVGLAVVAHNGNIFRVNPCIPFRPCLAGRENPLDG